MRRFLIVVGTRPEIIKTAPIVLEARKRSATQLNVTYCLTDQHQTMADEALKIFGIVPDYRLKIMKPGQTLNDITEAVFRKLPPIIDRYMPDALLVQGDTTTAAASALCAFNMTVPVAHIEAGLRSFNMSSPYPEECNRRLISVTSSYNFCPTERSKLNLLREGVPSQNVHITGNTVVDALQLIKSKHGLKDFSIVSEKIRAPFVLVTAHRRETFGDGFKNICTAIRNAALKYPYVQFVYPVHLNPNIKGPAHELLGEVRNVLLIPPVPYVELLTLLNCCQFVVTDSGGIQEEAPSFGKYCIVMRDVTERTESITAGVSELVGTDVNKICAAVEKAMDFALTPDAMNLYGDGRSSERILDILLTHLQDRR
jgi:UDP-N-acetylglucosamine 2-epimerase (non-hydrolysing)